MKLFFGIIAETGTETSIKETKMDDWARSQADKLKRALAEKAAQDATFREHQQIKRERGRGKWDEVRKQLSEKCESFNAEIGERILELSRTSSEETRIQATIRGTQFSVVVKFTGETGPLTWESDCGDPSGKYELEVKENGGLEFYEPKGIPVPSTPKSVAENIIGQLIDRASHLH